MTTLTVTAEGLLGALILCPHCNQKLRVMQVSTRLIGFDPARHYEPHGCFILELSDGASVRMWETEEVP